jgi:hypothetical protein
MASPSFHFTKKKPAGAGLRAGFKQDAAALLTTLRSG